MHSVDLNQIIFECRQLALTCPWDFKDPAEVGHRKCPDGKKGYQ